jgi:hypothetical protein
MQLQRQKNHHRTAAAQTVATLGNWKFALGPHVCAKVFAWCATKQKAVIELEAHVQKLKERWQKERKQPSLHKEQSKILRSMKRHWPGYTLFLEDPRLPLHKDVTSYCTSSVKLGKSRFNQPVSDVQEPAGSLLLAVFRGVRKGTNFCRYDGRIQALALATNLADWSSCRLI